jgi:hypothetical protein
MPSLFRSSSSMALPDDISHVIKVASGDEEACRLAASMTGERSSVLVEATRLYLKQILFRPDADCFRVLGISPGAPKSLARDHLRLLLIWLHPDLNRDGDSIFANRVVGAWNEYSRNPNARAKKIDTGNSRSSGKGRPSVRPPLIQVERQMRSTRGVKFWGFIGLALIGLCAAAVTAFLPEFVKALTLALSFDK